MKLKNDYIDLVVNTISGRIGIIFVGFAIYGIFCGVKNPRALLQNIVIAIALFFIAHLLFEKGRKKIANNPKLIKEQKLQNRLNALKRNATKCVGDYIYVDEPNQLWCVPENGAKQYAFSDLLDYEVIDNGEVVVGGSVLGTAVGAMAGGLTGALLGASASKATDWCNELKIKISVNDISTPTVEIPLIKKAELKDSNAYKKAVQTADEIAGVLKVIKARNDR